MNGLETIPNSAVIVCAAIAAADAEAGFSRISLPARCRQHAWVYGKPLFVFSNALEP